MDLIIANYYYVDNFDRQGNIYIYTYACIAIANTIREAELSQLFISYYLVYIH